MTRSAKLLGAAGLLLGAVLGVPVSQYAPVFGGFATIGQPWSQARQSLIGTHVLAFAAAGAVFGFLATWLRAKVPSGPKAFADAGDDGEQALEEPQAPRAPTARRRLPLLVLASVAGTLVLALGGISAFGRPNFSCRLGSRCAEYGACTGRGWSCVVGGKDDCVRSEGCRRGGQCTAKSFSADDGTVLDCQASSDAECARSEGCTTNNECVQWDGSCLTPERRDELRTLQNAAKDRTGIGLGEFLASAARGANTTIDVASFFVAANLDGYTVDNPTPRIVSLENGTIQFGDRRIPAAIIEASFVLANRAEGRKRDLCIHAAAARDQEFKVWREVVAKACGTPGAREAIDSWRTVNAFAPSSR